MNYIVCKHQEYFKKIGEYSYCNLEDMMLPEIIACDTETTGLEARKHEIFCIQIGTGENNYIIVLYNNNYVFEDVIPYLKNKTLIFHNALFDLGFFYKYNFYPEYILDTMLASKILYNGDVLNQRNDFGSVMFRELNIKYDKTEQKNIATVKLSMSSTIQYSFQDVDKLIELHSVLYQKILNGDYKKTYILHCRYIKALAYIEQCGLPVSLQLWQEKMIIDNENAVKWGEKIKKYIFDNIPEYRQLQLSLWGDEEDIIINLTSPLQMVKVFNKLGINTKDKDGKDSINENIISKNKHEFVEMWLNYQEAQHRVTTFGDKIFQKIENGRIYTSFNPAVETARLSTRKGYINFLNFPADKITRNCFEAQEGNVMVVCDYSGQENVLSADLSEDEAMTSSVVNGSDLHCAFARVIFPEIKDLSDAEIIEKHKNKRQASKSPRFAFAYGGNAYTIHMNEGIPYERALEIERAFKELHAGIYKWGEEVFNISVQKGYIESADGWKLKLPEYEKFKSLKGKIEVITRDEWQMYKIGKEERKKEKENTAYIIKNIDSYNFYKEKRKSVSDFFKLKSEYQRLCLNNPVQARGAHQIKYATCLFFEWIKRNYLLGKVLITNSIHDELAIECSIDIAEKVKINLEKCMIKGGNHYLEHLEIKADANIGTSWGKAK